MQAFDRKTLSVLFTTLTVAAALWIAWLARRTLLTFLLAVFFAYLLEPIVEAVRLRVHGSRARAIAITYAVLVLVVGGAILVAAPRLAAEGAALGKSVPAFVSQISSGRIAQTIGQQHGWSYQTRATIERWIASHQASLEGAASDLGARVAQLSANAGWLLLVPIFSLFLLKDKSCFSDAVLALFHDERQRAFWRSVFEDLDRMLAQYIRAQLLLVIAATIAYTVFLGVMRFPYALGIGVLAGMLEFIPVIGPAITAVLIFMVGFFGGYAHWLIVIAFVGVWRVIQDYVNAPYIMGEGLELHPLAAIFGVLVGGEVAGVAGMFLSIPIIAALRIVWRNWQLVDGVEIVEPDRAVAPDAASDAPPASKSATVARRAG